MLGRLSKVAQIFRTFVSLLSATKEAGKRWSLTVTFSAGQYTVWANI